MKKTLLALPLLTAILFSCKPDNYSAAEINVENEQITVEFNATEGSFEYGITNPRETASVLASTDAAWISGFDYSKDGVVVFGISENENKEAREAKVTVSYTEGGNTLSMASVTVIQSAFPNSGITIKTASPITVEFDSKEASFEYEIAEPREGAKVSVSANAAWISDIDSSKEGVVLFSISENSENLSREAKLTLSYVEGNTTLCSADITVIQNAIPEPTITVTTQSPVILEFDAEKGSFEYKILNPREYGEVAASSNVSWIKGFDYSEVGIISFVVEKNEGRTRDAELTVSYIDGLETLSSASVRVSQNACPDSKIQIKSTSLNIEYNAADVSFEYGIINPVEGAVLSVSASASWAKEFKTDNRKISFTVEQNDGESRNCTITLDYIYNGTVLTSASIDLIQEKKLEYVEFTNEEFLYSDFVVNPFSDYIFTLKYIGKQEDKYIVRWEYSDLAENKTAVFEFLVGEDQIENNSIKMFSKFTIKDEMLLPGAFNDGKLSGSYCTWKKDGKLYYGLAYAWGELHWSSEYQQSQGNVYISAETRSVQGPNMKAIYKRAIEEAQMPEIEGLPN